jgi:hypothetical protein
MKPRTLVLLVLAIGALAAGSAYLIRLWTEPLPAREGAPVEAEPPPPPPAPQRPEPQATLTPSEVADPVEARRLELTIEQRAVYRSLRDGFKGPRSASTRQRLEPALRALWPQVPPGWSLACRGRVCSVVGPGEATTWQAALLADPGVTALADRVVVDPDGVDPVAFVVVAPGPAGSGEDLLAGLEKQLRASPLVQACLTQGSGTIEYELHVDESGITYRAGGTAPPPVADCVGTAFRLLVTSTNVPPKTKAATRVVQLTAAP